jgi:hypothetical protein
VSKRIAALVRFGMTSPVFLLMQPFSLRTALVLALASVSSLDAQPANPPGGQVVERPVRDPAREEPPASALIQAPPSARDRSLRF